MSSPAMTCEQFEESLDEYLEGGLADADRAVCEFHLSQCATCAALVSDLDRIVVSARALPVLEPARDLWPAIEDRLDTPVLVMPTRPSLTVHSRQVSWRTVAAAAAVLITVSAGVTWNVARRGPAMNGGTASALASATDSMTRSVDSAADGSRSWSPTDDGSVLDAPPTILAAPLSGDARSGVVASAPTQASSTNAVLVSSPDARVVALDSLYGREIATLRSVAESQLGLLDTATVNVVRRNLDIIDNAILESRAALASDPNSGFLLEQLDRAYERKVDLLRRLALL